MPRSFMVKLALAIDEVDEAAVTAIGFVKRASQFEARVKAIQRTSAGDRLLGAADLNVTDEKGERSMPDQETDTSQPMLELFQAHRRTAYNGGVGLSRLLGRRRQGGLLAACLVCGALLLSTPAWAQASQAKGEFDHPEHGSLAEVGAKLANPVSDVWALFTEFDLTFSDGDLNSGDAEVGGRMIFQPVLPIPLFGEAEEQWKLITRPIVPILFSQPVPKGFDDFDNLAGIGDIQLPMLVSPPSGNWLLGLGPTWLLPSATRDEFGRDQWGVGPAAVLGYKTKKWTAGIFPQYTWGIGGWNDDDKPDASYLSMLYFFIYNLPDAWQIGLNPTISYDHRASSGNKWNVPVGLFVAKTTKIGNIPVKMQFGVEYSVVSQDDFGQRAQIKLNIIPVIPSLIKRPLFGG